MIDTLKKPLQSHIILATEYLRQYTSGEREAGYWNWYFNGIQVDAPAFSCKSVYLYEPAIKHPHYAIWEQWEAHKASKAVERGYYDLRIAVGHGQFEVVPTTYNQWHVGSTHIISKTNLHPDNLKPAIKLLNWEQAPIGTLTDCGVISGWATAMKYVVVFDGFRVKHIDPKLLRLINTEKWTAVQDRKQPPVCEGLVIEYRVTDSLGRSMHARDLSTIVGVNAYRVVGLAHGWTDDPAKAGV
jgi:hypothetical protein